jgi:hypothetical protein
MRPLGLLGQIDPPEHQTIGQYYILAQYPVLQVNPFESNILVYLTSLYLQIYNNSKFITSFPSFSAKILHSYMYSSCFSGTDIVLKFCMLTYLDLIR